MMSIWDLHDQPGHLIRRAHQVSGAIYAKNLTGYDLTSVQFAALVAIGSNPGIDATRLSDMIVFDKATMGGVLDRLEAKLLVRRSPCASDRRVKTVSLTTAGATLLAEVEQKVLMAQAQMLAPFSAADRRRFIDLLKKFVAPAGPQDV